MNNERELAEFIIERLTGGSSTDIDVSEDIDITEKAIKEFNEREKQAITPDDAKTPEY